MNKIIFIFIFSFTFLFSKGQDFISPIYKADSVNHEFKIKFQGYYHNQSLTNEFTGLFINGGHLDTNLKNSISKNLLDNNRMGAEINWGIKYLNHHAHLFGKPSWGWYASAENIGFHHAEFSENAFNLLFYGNSRFAGDTIPLNNVNFESIIYQKFTIGGFHKENHSFVGISFLKGQNYSNFSMTKADFYTAPLGEEINLNVNAGYTQSDTLKNKWNDFNGWGLSTDLVFYLNIGKNKNVKFQNAFKIAITDLGFIHWNENSLKTEIDSNYIFNGFDVTDLFDSASYNFSDRMKDSLNINSFQNSFTKVLPFSFSFTKIADPFNGEKLQGVYGFRMRAFSHYKPLFFAGIFYQPIKKLNMNLYASVGGYGGFRLGYNLGTTIIKNFHLSLSCSDLLGWSKKSKGMDAFIQLSYAF